MHKMSGNLRKPALDEDSTVQALGHETLERPRAQCGRRAQTTVGGRRGRHVSQKTQGSRQEAG